jgi:hypothetical protein
MEHRVLQMRARTPVSPPGPLTQPHIPLKGRWRALVTLRMRAYMAGTKRRTAPPEIRGRGALGRRSIPSRCDLAPSLLISRSRIQH